MTDGAGADAIGDWYGRGPERGIAIVFSIAGLFGVLATIAAFRSKSYRRISAAYNSETDDNTGALTEQPV
jgi:DHA3 family multidrug efflux protein-like MFS transporter